MKTKTWNFKKERQPIVVEFVNEETGEVYYTSEYSPKQMEAIKKICDDYFTPEPRPIEELFEMDKDCYVWLLMSDEYDNDITIGRFEKGGYLKCLGLVQCDKNDFTHFIPAQIPKF